MQIAYDLRFLSKRIAKKLQWGMCTQKAAIQGKPSTSQVFTRTMPGAEDTQMVVQYTPHANLDEACTSQSLRIETGDWESLY